MKQEIKPPIKPQIIQQKDNQAIFEIAPCYSGYGVTLGNALRRVLLSSLEGSAVTQIKIAGVHHEFSTIPNVIEDVVEIMLNFKKLRLKMHSDKPIKLLLKIQGEKKVLAKDIKAPTDVEIINKNLHLATLTSRKAVLEIEIQVEKGLGYVSAEQMKDDKSEIGAIKLDAVFTPIKKINYTVENMRVGERTDFNKLLLDIETDGTITPKQAFEQAGKILVDHFKVFTSTEIAKAKKAVEKYKTIAKKAVAKKAGPSLKDILVEDMKLSTRTVSVLRDNRIKSAASLAKKNEDKLLALDGMGEKGVKEIRRELGKLGVVIDNKK